MEAAERCVLITLGDEAFGIPLRQLVSIEPMQRVVPVPSVPAWLLGVTYRQGQVLSVVDLAGVLAIEPDGDEDAGHQRLLVAADGELCVALAVPSVTEVRNVAREHIEPVPPLPDRPINRFLTGRVANGEPAFGLINLHLLMGSPEFNLRGEQAAYSTAVPSGDRGGSLGIRRMLE